MAKVLNQFERPMGGPLWDLVCQVIESRRNPLDVVREQLSNCCATEVEASEVQVIYYDDPVHRASFIIKDDGCGMDLTNDDRQPGRLDKFLDVARSAHAGFDTDEFGFKGLGAKFAMNCQRLEVRTYHRATGQSFLVYVDDPMSYLRGNRPPEFKVVQGAGLPAPGTEIRILGIEGGESRRAFRFDRLRRYLYFKTIVGHTRPRQMPRFLLRTPDEEEELRTGFPYLTCEAASDWKTYVLPEPIVTDAEAPDGSRVRVVLKGGFTLETGNHDITGDYTLTGDRAGLFLSIKGIPYVRLDFNHFRSSFSTLSYKFCRFVAECDDLFNHMDFARGYYRDDDVTATFESALRACFDKLSDDPPYRAFLRERERDRHVRQRESLDGRKEALESPEQEFVYLAQDRRRIHRVPDNEHDTLALLWKLEALEALPFDFFETLEHTALEGIDVLANYREEPDGHTHKLVPIEVEDVFEEYIPHGHRPEQTGMVICWKVDDPELLEKSEHKRYLFFFRSGDVRIPIYEIQSFPTIVFGTRRDMERARP